MYLFAHETLRVTAEEQLGSEVARYRQGIHDWIGSYASSGWPDTTPGYAVRGYPRLLTATRDVMRLSALARDPRRHAFLLRATGSDYAALTEIRDAQRLIAAQDVPDLQALVELAVYRHAISIRNQSIPVGLPAVWARLARFDHAEALARTITDPDDQAGRSPNWSPQPLRPETRPRDSLAPTPRPWPAPSPTPTTRRERSPSWPPRPLRPETWTARPGWPPTPRPWPATITDPSDRARALTELAAAAAQAGDLDRAEALARTITDP